MGPREGIGIDFQAYDNDYHSQFIITVQTISAPPTRLGTEICRIQSNPTLPYDISIV